MKKVNSSLIFLLFAFICISSPVFGATDYKCMSDCSLKGYMHRYCKSLCSYDRGGVSNTDRGIELGKETAQQPSKSPFVAILDGYLSERNKRKQKETETEEYLRILERKEQIKRESARIAEEQRQRGRIELEREKHKTTNIVERVIDGDTIELSNGDRVRLIGVDTPETVHPNKPVEYFGIEASTFTKQLCEGQRILLKYDQTKKDKYQSILAYVYLEDGTFVNAEIIKQGYGHAYTKYPFKYIEQFREYEKLARENKKGLWK